MSNKKFPEMQQQRFGRWTALKYLGRIEGKSMWLCCCDCGTSKSVLQTSLRSGKSQSCGCLNRELHRTTHGLSGSKLQKAWHNMMYRCYNAARRDYKNYGGRGITVCDRWRASLSDFAADMGEPPTKRHSLDRIDNDGPYCPSNCRWATMREQRRNQRTSHLLTVGGKTQCVTDWARELGVRPETLFGRLRLGWTAERVVTTQGRRSS